MSSPKSRRKKTAEPGLFASQGFPLDAFMPEVADWFRASVGTPTEAQARGWPSIQAGNHTLIVAPTGSGKTLAAFLAVLDVLWRDHERAEGVQTLYISPLKALNQDVERNLNRPLSGVGALAQERGIKLPPIRTGVRTGDTPASQRQAQARKPPDVLITTPESLHLILGSQARRILKPVRWVIIDELHALAGQKRGTFLAILLERLVQEIGRDPVRIGLTATVNPLEMAARFLGGYEPVEKKSEILKPRPVEIIRASVPKAWDLQVSQAQVEPDPNQPRTIWPSLEKELVGLIGSHRSTLVFANNRYLVERLAARINEHVESSQDSEDSIDNDDSVRSADDAESVESRDKPEDFVHAHHGSVSLERRRLTETALKEGRLKGVISTASLEMGIDMGAVDLVCQVGSPGEVARGLQRVGRAGHGVGEVSKGRFFAKTTADLLETAALVEAMGRGAVEPLAIPQNCLDLLAQQIVACVAVRSWKPRELLNLFRRSYPYHDLPEAAFESVLEMLSGRFRVEAIRDLKARVFWDRVRDELVALPGTSALALTGGGAIPDTGQYPVKLRENGPTLGSLDEEFVLERRPGEAFRLGSSTWRIDRIEADRVIVSPSGGGDMIVMPFWRGEESRRSATLGAAIGSLVRRVANAEDSETIEHELVEQCRLTPDAARDLVRMIRRQKRLARAVPDDRTIIVEAFRDPAGEVALAILSPWGGRVHQALKLILQNRLNERYGFRPAAQHADDGLIMRLPRGLDDQPPLDLLDDLDFDEADRRLREELADSALFGLRFRQNSSRALLLPRPDPGKRTPLWLQRLRSKDLLQVVRQMPDFPIVLECYRECLTQDLDLEMLRSLLDQVASGAIKLVKRSGEAASPFAADLMNRFERKFLYEWDEPHKAKGSRERAGVSEPPPGELLDQLLDSRSIEKLGSRFIQAWQRPAKTAEELAERFTRLGDLSAGEVSEHHKQHLEELRRRGLCCCLSGKNESRAIWVSSEDETRYAIAFPGMFDVLPQHLQDNNELSSDRWAAIDFILSRYIRNRSLVSLAEITSRYPLDPSIAAQWLEKWTQSGGFVRVQGFESDSAGTRWADARQMQRLMEMSLAERRRDVKPVAPDAWAAWVLDRSLAGNATDIRNAIAERGKLAGLDTAMLPLQGWAATCTAWREEILPVRLPEFLFEQVDALLAQGDWHWQAVLEGEMAPVDPKIAFLHKAFPSDFILNANESAVTDEFAECLLKSLTENGPGTSSELSARMSRPLTQVKEAIRRLVQVQQLTNEKVAFLDRFFAQENRSDGRSGRQEMQSVQTNSGGRRLNSFRALLAQQGVGGRGMAGRTNTAIGPAMEGRWRILNKTDAISHSEIDRDERLAAWSAILTERYGVVCREVVNFAAPGLAWSELADWLEAAEWRGEVRRGYFVEGLSGLQFTTDEISSELSRFCQTLSHGSNESETAIFLVSAVDPVNLYGASAPLDLPLLEAGKARLPRIPGNALVMADGKPVWIVQERGKRLTSLPHASEELLKLALRFLVRNFTRISTKWTVGTLDDAPPVTTRWADELAELGFVRDGLSMTLYRGLV